jgi:hypothetical protein
VTHQASGQHVNHGGVYHRLASFGQDFIVLFTSIITTDALNIGRFRRLAVHDRSTGHRFPAIGFPKLCTGSHVDVFPDSILPPNAEAVIDGLLRRKVVGQHPPSTVGTQQVEDGVQNLTKDIATFCLCLSWALASAARSFAIRRLKGQLDKIIL